MERYDELKKGESGALVSIAAYLVLSAIKLIIGYLFHSEALTADGLNNTTDIIASVAVLIGMRISQKPPDEDHPYLPLSSGNDCIAYRIVYYDGCQYASAVQCRRIYFFC